MSKKTKITLLLTSIVLGLGICAQFYTNHKIDQGLQNFPYHLKDRLTLDVVEKKRHFFKRELMFILKDEEHQTDIITTQLTALPFAITAESKLPPALVQQLNKKLNITIDKNTINSQFSVVGDYLQSQILTEFRDLTNKAQQLEININYASKTKSMEVQSELSGFNYDAKTKFEGLKGQYVLTPIGEHQYDITSLDLDLKHADIFLLNGENTHIKLENAHYEFDKTLSAQHYDTALTFNSEKVILSNKYKKSPQENILMTQLDFALQQSAVPNHISFYQEAEKFIDNTPSLSEAFITLIDLLRHNDGIKSQIALKELIIPEQAKPFIQAKDLRFSVDADLQNKHDSNITLEWHLGDAKLVLNPNEAPQNVLQLNRLDSKHSLTQIDIEKRLAFVPFYANLWRHKEKHATKEEMLAFKQALTHLAENFKEKTQDQFTLSSLRYGNRFTLKDLNVDYQETPVESNQYQMALNASLSHFSDAEQHVELKQVKLNLPLNIRHNQDAFLAYSCGLNSLYQSLCEQYLSAETQKAFTTSALKQLAFNLNAGNLNLQLDTLPNTQTNTLNVDLNFDLDTRNMGDDPSLPEFFQHLNLDTQTRISKSVFHPNEQAINVRKNHEFWHLFNDDLNKEILRYFKEEGDQYLNHSQIKAGQTWVNGQTLQALHEQLQQANETPMSEDGAAETEAPTTLEQTTTPQEQTPTENTTK
ncbi:hypothetical protein ACPEER_02650 [Pasteurella sp. PK-2025]|uniref:hypothetical protein n=1 Tax=Pasteurella sp. PK-2025 TaxID=3413133 RepID=UPI003C7723A1